MCATTQQKWDTNEVLFCRKLEVLSKTTLNVGMLISTPMVGNSFAVA
jgi:hypothetical protein